MRKEILFGIGLIVLVMLTRFLPHPPNFTPILAIALFGGAIFKNKLISFIVPISAMFISDLFLGLHESLWAVYLSLAAIIFIGMKTKKDSPKSVLFNSFVSAIIFFLVTNFSVWAFTAMYPKSFAGLIQSYTMAIPFFKWTIASTLVYSGVLFTSNHYLEKNFASKGNLAENG